MEYILLIVGFVFLIKGADFFVDGSSSIARNLKVPSIIIGLTLVSMGTSAPEAAVSITAGLRGNSDIAIGNVIGSNIFNLLSVIGCAAIFRPIPLQKELTWRDIPVSCLATVAVLIMMLNGTISRVEGIILLAGIVAYMISLVIGAMKNQADNESSEEKILPMPLSIFFVVLGLAGVIAGGQLVVNNAKIIARNFGLSDTLIALTVVAIGTSLPELVTSVMAAKKGDSGIALGNAIGSSIFNSLFIVGIASTISPISVESQLIVDMIVLILIHVLLFIFCYTRDTISRFEGTCLVSMYIIYTVYIILR